MRSWGSFTWVALLVLVFGTSVHAQDAVTGYATIKPSLVKVWALSRTGTPIDSGSGFVVSSNASDSVLLTSNHVIAEGSRISIDFNRELHDVPATVVAREATWDLALLRIGRGNLKSVAFAPRDHTLAEGVTLAAAGFFKRDDQIGFTGQEAHLLYPGSISSLARDNDVVELANVQLEPGTSGGPVFDPATGAVVAVVERSHTDQQGGYAVAASVVLAFAQAQRVTVTIQRLTAPRPSLAAVVVAPTPARPLFIGVSMKPVDSNVRAQLRYLGQGIVVESVYQGGPAEQAGVQTGDVIQLVDGKPAITVQQVQEVIRAAGEGQIVRLGLWSSTGNRAVNVVVGRAPPDFPLGQTQSAPAAVQPALSQSATPIAVVPHVPQQPPAGDLPSFPGSGTVAILYSTRGAFGNGAETTTASAADFSAKFRQRFGVTAMLLQEDSMAPGSDFARLAHERGALTAIVFEPTFNMPTTTLISLTMVVFDPWNSSIYRVTKSKSGFLRDADTVQRSLGDLSDQCLAAFSSAAMDSASPDPESPLFNFFRYGILIGNGVKRIGLGLQPSTNGARVITLTSGGPAASAGMQIGDLVLTVNGVATTGKSIVELTELLKKNDAVGPIDFEILGPDGMRKHVKVVAGDLRWWASNRPPIH